jgi:hypothetical protein
MAMPFSALLLLFSCLLAARPAAQSPVLLQATGTSTKALSQSLLSLPARPRPGSLLALVVGLSQPGSAMVSGGGCSQWVRLHQSATNGPNLQIFAGIVDGPRQRQVTINLIGGPQAASLSLGEWQGLIGVPLVAATGQSGTAAAAAPLASTPSLLVRRSDLVLAALFAPRANEPIPAPTLGGKTLPVGGSPAAAAASVCWFVPDADGPLHFAWPFVRPQEHAAAMASFRMPDGPTQSPVLAQHTMQTAHDAAALQVQLASPPQPGSLLVVCHESNSSSDSTVQGGGVAVWTLCASSAGDVVNSEVWAGVVGLNPSPLLQLTLGSSPNGAIAVVSEWRGLPAPLGYSVHMATSTAGSTAVRTQSVRAQAGELLIAMAGIHQGGNTISQPGGGFAEFAQAYLPSAAMSAAWLLPQQDGVFAAAWSMAHATRWAAPVVVFGGR